MRRREGVLNPPRPEPNPSSRPNQFADRPATTFLRAGRAGTPIARGEDAFATARPAEDRV